MSLYIKLKIFQVFNHIMLIFGLYYMYNTGEWSWLLVSMPIAILFGTFGIGTGFHRMLSHQAFKTSRFWEVVLSICGIYATSGSTITWVGVHRLHHANAEKQVDPHSPYTGRGPGEQHKFSWKLAIKGWFNFWNIEQFSPRYVANMVRDPFHVFLHVHYYKILLSTIIILALINPLFVVFLYCIPACTAMHSVSFIIVVAHSHGYRTYNTNDMSRNSWIANVATLGDGWHNNHHANPGNWTTKEKWWEIDPQAWFIRLIKK
jgi:fatty-acid desaturase